MANGSFFINEDFTEPWYDRPETIEAFQFVHDLMWEHGVAPTGSFNFREAFVAGTLGMMIDSPAGRQRLIPAGMSADDYDVNFFPTKVGRGGQRLPMGHRRLRHHQGQRTPGFGLGNGEALWSAPMSCPSCFRANIASASAPARTSLASDPVLVAASPANYWRFYEALDGGRTVINAPYFAELAEIHDRYMSQAWANEMSVADAAANIQADMEAVIAENS